MTQSTASPTVVLNNGVVMPQMGLGLGNGVSDDDLVPIVESALEIGYRSFDTATKYRNERGLGRALTVSGLPRAEVFVTSKVWHTDQGSVATRAAFERSLEALRLDYLDLYLIHFPAAELGLFVETWRTLEDLVAEGRVRSIGVANFDVHHLDTLRDASETTPAVNQVELQPRLQQRPLRAVHDQRGIRTAAWGPLARGLVLREPIVQELAQRHGVTPAQIVLRWHLQLGNIVVPRSTSPHRLAENFGAVAAPVLDDSEMAAFDALDSDGRTGPHPDGDIDGIDMRLPAIEERWNAILRRTAGPA